MTKTSASPADSLTCIALYVIALISVPCSWRPSTKRSPRLFEEFFGFFWLVLCVVVFRAVRAAHRQAPLPPPPPQHTHTPAHAHPSASIDQPPRSSAVTASARHTRPSVEKTKSSSSRKAKSSECRSWPRAEKRLFFVCFFGCGSGRRSFVFVFVWTVRRERREKGRREVVSPAARPAAGPPPTINNNQPTKPHAPRHRVVEADALERRHVVEHRQAGVGKRLLQRRAP